MPKISVDYKIVERDNFTVVTKQAKQVFDWDAVPLENLAKVLQSPGLEYLVVRRVKERVIKPPKVEVKK